MSKTRPAAVPKQFSDFDLEEVEASIRRCEQFLAEENYTFTDSAGSNAQSGSLHGSAAPEDGLPTNPAAALFSRSSGVRASNLRISAIESRPARSSARSPPKSPKSPVDVSNEFTPIRRASATAMTLPDYSEGARGAAASEPAADSALVPRAAYRPVASARTYSRMEEYRRQREEEELRECTFRPAINAPAGARPRDLSAEPAGDRLTAEGERRRQDLERTRVLRQRAEYVECTFRPNINHRSRKLAGAKARRPVYERYAEESRRKRMQQAAEPEEPAASFQPNQFMTDAERQHRDALASRALQKSGIDPSAPASRRLGSPAARRSDKAARALAAAEAEQAVECTFKPRINAASAELTARNRALQEGFLQRQAQYEERRRLKLAGLERQTYDLPFQPTLQASGRRSASEAGRAGGAGAPGTPDASAPGPRSASVFDKLYQNARAHAARATDDALLGRAEELGECTFRPAINEVSQTIGRPSTVAELHANTLSGFRRQALQKQAEAEQARECTFRPAVARPGAAAHYRLAQPETIIAQIELERQQRAARLSMMKKRLEYEEVERCSFRPDVRPDVPRAIYRGPVVSARADEATLSSIRGLGRFMEVQELARRKAEEQRLREEKVFSTVLSASTHGPYTVPRPFNLSSDTGAARRKALREEAAREVDRELTFRPRTSEHRIHELVQTILRND